MPVLPEEPLTKITLHLFSRDVADLKRWVGPGYQVYIRNVVREYCKNRRRVAKRMDELDD
jgi:hypothetical protein